MTFSVCVRDCTKWQPRNCMALASSGSACKTLSASARLFIRAFLWTRWTLWNALISWSFNSISEGNYRLIIFRNGLFFIFGGNLMKPWSFIAGLSKGGLRVSQNEICPEAETWQFPFNVWALRVVLMPASVASTNRYCRFANFPRDHRRGIFSDHPWGWLMIFCVTWAPSLTIKPQVGWVTACRLSAERRMIRPKSQKSCAGSIFPKSRTFYQILKAWIDFSIVSKDGSFQIAESTQRFWQAW